MHRPLRLATGVALALILGAGTGAAASPVGRPIAAIEDPWVAEACSRLLRQADPNPEELVAALLALGPAAIEPAIDALRDESVPAGEGELRVRLAPKTLVAVHKALSQFEHAQVLANLRLRVASSPEWEQRKVVIEILGNLGEAADLGLLLEAATPAADGVGFDVRPVMLTQPALERILARHPAALENVAKRLTSVHEALAPALARAIGSSRSPKSFDLLVGALGVNPAIDMVVIPNLARAEGRNNSSQRGRALEVVRADLASSEPMLARLAAIACGELGDHISASALCELLEGHDPKLTQAAHEALQQLSALSFTAQRSRWQMWLRLEETWYRSEADFTLGQLRSKNEKLVLQALETLAQHPLYRESFTPSVVAVTSRSEPSLRSMACSVLGRWRSRASIPLLRDLARDPSPEVAKAAAEALHSIDPQPLASK